MCFITVITRTSCLKISCIYNNITESPGPPSHLRVSNVTNTSAVLSWSPPDDGGGRPLYEIVYTITATGECLSYPSKLPYTVEPPNKGHYGASDLVPCERSSLSLRSNNTLKYLRGDETRVLCREVVPISELGSLVGGSTVCTVCLTFLEFFSRSEFKYHNSVA